MRRKRKNMWTVPMTFLGMAAVAVCSLAASSVFPQYDDAKNENISSSSGHFIVEESYPEFFVCGDVPLEADLQKKAQEFCGDYGVPYEIALAVIYQESRFDENADNGSCVGLMQVNRINSQWLNDEIGITDLTDTEQNLQAGIWMLGSLFEKYGEWNMALTAYNNGETGAKSKFFSEGKISCAYSESVLSDCERWRTMLEGNHE